jgi:hypothetical protein
MKDFFRWLLKSMLIGVAWVFILSIPLRGETLFQYAQGILVQNSLMDLVDRELDIAWDKFKVTARAALADEEPLPEMERAF